MKQGGIHRNWKKRWFCNTVDDPFTLSYYTDENCKSKKGQIDLREVYHFRTKFDTKERGPKQRVGLALVTPSRTWKLIVTGSTNGDYWTQGLERLIHKARKIDAGGDEAPVTLPADAETDAALAAAVEDSARKGIIGEDEEDPAAAADKSGAAAASDKPTLTATALFQYTAANSNELSFQKGDKLTILQRDDEAGWWAAELNGKRGWVSSFYVSLDS